MVSRLPSKDALQNAGLVLASLAFAIGLMEVGLRISGPDLNASPLWRYDSAYGWTIDPDAGSIEPISGDGFRHRPVSRTKPRGTRRLLVLGDSFAQATGIRYDSTFPGFIETWLNQGRTGETWEVINLGVGDWGSGQQLLALIEHGLELELDAVAIQVFPFNDFCNNSRLLAGTCSMQDFHRPYVEVEAGRLRVAHISSWRAALRKRLVLFGLLENRLGLARQVELSQSSGDRQGLARSRNAFFKQNAERIGLPYSGAMASLVPTDHQPPQLREAWGSSERIFEQMAEILGREGIPLVAVVVPFKHTFTQAWQRFNRTPDKPFVADHGTERFERLLETLDVPTVSVRDRVIASGMEPGDFFHTTDSHFDAYGHFRVAAWILEILAAEGLTDKGPPDPSFDGGDLISQSVSPAVRITGLAAPRRNRRRGPLWRAAFGRSSSIVFWSAGVQTMNLHFRLDSLIAEQRIVLRINGATRISSTSADRQGESLLEQALAFVTVPGRNEIRFSYLEWTEGATPSRVHAQPTAAKFRKLSVQ